MSIAAALNAKTVELRKSRDELAGALQSVQALATASGKERGLKGGDATVNDDDALRAINKAIKMVRDTLSLAPEDAKPLRELSILEALLPAQASEDDILAEIEAFKTTDEDRSGKFIGKAMAHLTAKFGAALDKSKASSLVKQSLSA